MLKTKKNTGTIKLKRSLKAQKSVVFVLYGVQNPVEMDHKDCY